MKKKKRKPRQAKQIHQFLIVLSESDPLVWRRIEVPGGYSFWDLHVAIQDSMGWTDSHLHEFKVLHPKTGTVEAFGIPDDDFGDVMPCRPGWESQLSEYFVEDGLPATYVYDFGDDWRHVVICQGMWPADPGVTYPRCVAGERACPPEDCGGVHGYVEFLQALRDPKHPEHAEYLEWVGREFDADRLDPVDVVFDDPQERWRRAFIE